MSSVTKEMNLFYVWNVLISFPNSSNGCCEADLLGLKILFQDIGMRPEHQLELFFNNKVAMDNFAEWTINHIETDIHLIRKTMDSETWELKSKTDVIFAFKYHYLIILLSFSAIPDVSLFLFLYKYNPYILTLKFFLLSQLIIKLNWT